VLQIDYAGDPKPEPPEPGDPEPPRSAPKQPANQSLQFTLQRHGQQTQIPVISVKTSDVQDMMPMLRSLIPSSEELCGISRTGIVPEWPPQVRREVLKAGEYLASYLLEGWFGLLLSAIYVYITVTIGFPVFSGVWGRVVVAAELDDDEWYVVLLDYLIAHIDAHLYVFMGAILMTVHRLMTGRRLFTRFCARSLVIVESTVNYKLLRSYVSKLRALSFRFTTFGVAGQNATDHFVHEMTHLTTSEVIVIAGRPDGRIGTLASTEAANIMSLQQARYIAANPNTGVELISVGHNPWTKPGLFSQVVTLSTEHRPHFLTSELLCTKDGAHAPADVMHGVATLAHGDSSKAGDRAAAEPFSWIRMDDIKVRMKSVKTVPLALAREILSDMVTEFAEDLHVDPAEFAAESVLTDEAAAMLTGKRLPKATSLRAVGGTESTSPSVSLPTDGVPGQVEGSDSQAVTTSPSKVHRATTNSISRSGTMVSDVSVLQLTAPNIMATLRGTKMADVVKELQVSLAAKHDQEGRDGSVEKADFYATAHRTFQAWADFTIQEKRDREECEAAEKEKVEAAEEKGVPQAPEWRKREE
jgi:hypothetical protein